MTTQQTTLNNGLRIVTTDIADARSITVTILAGVGSRYEQFSTNGGVSHFLEHLLFKGSRKYPSAQAIAEAVDAVGGINNAFTAEDVTWYFIKVPAAHGELALDILSDMVQTPLFDTVEVDRERGVIVEEMNVYRDDPARFVNTLVPSLIFPDNALGRDIIGSEDVIENISVTEIADYQKKYYAPNNLVVSVAGHVDHESVVRQMTATFTSTSGPTVEPAQMVGPDLAHDLAAYQSKPTAQAHFVVAARAFPHEHPNDRASKVISAILGHGMSSRLFDNVRERQGLAYTVYTDIGNYVDTGIFTTYVGANLDKTDQALTSVLHELERICREPVAPSELAKAKQQLQAGLEMSLESNSSVAERNGQELLLQGHLRSVDDLIAEIESVSAEEVQRVASEMLAPEKLRLGVIAPNPEGVAEHFASIIMKGNQ